MIIFIKYRNPEIKVGTHIKDVVSLFLAKLNSETISNVLEILFDLKNIFSNLFFTYEIGN